MHCSFVPRLYIGSSVDVLEPARRSPVVWSSSSEIAVIGRAVVNNLPMPTLPLWWIYAASFHLFLRFSIDNAICSPFILYAFYRIAPMKVLLFRWPYRLQYSGFL